VTGRRSDTVFKQQTHLRLPAACFARVLLSVSLPHQKKGAGKAGRRLAPESVRRKNAHGGGLQVSPDARPSLRDGVNVSFVLSSGSDALLPPSPPRMADARSGRSARITAGLDASHRTSGPHDLFVRARPRWDFGGWRVLAPEAMPGRLSASCRTRNGDCSRSPALQCRSRPPPSRPSHPCPRFVTIAIRPL
jgi:hypothetical protein